MCPKTRSVALPKDMMHIDVLKGPVGSPTEAGCFKRRKKSLQCHVRKSDFCHPIHPIVESLKKAAGQKIHPIQLSQ